MNLSTRQKPRLPTRMTIRDVAAATARYYRINLEELIGRDRIRDITYPRNVSIFLCRRHLKVSTEMIGREIGGRDHTTICHLIKSTENRLEEDEVLRSEIAAIEFSLGFDPAAIASRDARSVIAVADSLAQRYSMAGAMAHASAVVIREIHEDAEQIFQSLKKARESSLENQFVIAVLDAARDLSKNHDEAFSQSFDGKARATHIEKINRSLLAVKAAIKSLDEAASSDAPKPAVTPTKTEGETVCQK